MPIERPPKKPAPRIPIEPSVKYRPGTDPKRLEDWKTVANDFNVNVHYLIYFNFQTNNPDIVNWYLRNYVGCKRSRDGLNWAFSPEATPGVIYIPTQPFSFTEIVAPGPSGRNRLARYIDRIEENIEDSPSENWERRHFLLDIAEIAHISIAVAGALEESLVGLGIEVAGPFMTFAATWMSLGGAVLGAIDHRKQDEMLRGFSYGVVLGANGASAQWIRGSWFAQGQQFNDVNYPDYVNQFKLAYFSGLKVGLAYGRQLNGAEAAILMKMLSIKAQYGEDEYISYWDRAGGELPLMTFVKWKKENIASKHDGLGDRQKVDYYVDCAARFRRDFLPSPN